LTKVDYNMYLKTLRIFGEKFTVKKARVRMRLKTDGCKSNVAISPTEILLHRHGPIETSDISPTLTYTNLNDIPAGEYIICFFSNGFEAEKIIFDVSIIAKPKIYPHQILTVPQVPADTTTPIKLEIKGENINSNMRMRIIKDGDKCTKNPESVAEMPNSVIDGIMPRVTVQGGEFLLRSVCGGYDFTTCPDSSSLGATCMKNGLQQVVSTSFKYIIIYIYLAFVCIYTNSKCRAYL
jgi:hypothetical protein